MIVAKKWTDEQALAIDERGKSLLLSAAAGSGKTAVLVERIIEMISSDLDLVDIDELLIVTFTNAAAAEMKERISMAINKQLQLKPQSTHLYRQSLLLQKAQITTLHAFCLDLVRSNFFKLDIDPNLKIGDEMECQILKQEVLDELFEDYYGLEAGGEGFLALIDAYGGREDEGVGQLVLALHQLAMSMPDWLAWLASLEEKLVETPWVDLLLPILRSELAEIKQSLGQALAISEKDEGLAGYLPILEADYGFFTLLTKATDEGWDSLYEKIAGNLDPFGRMPRVKKESYDEANKEAIEALRKGAKTRYKKLKEVSCTRTKEALLADIECLRPYVGLLADLTKAFHLGYQEKKKGKNLMDFDDMEHFCLQLLYEVDEQGKREFTELSLILQERFREVLVDEYQDINDLQEQILQAVSRADNLFMVGDIKQSIYGFRMANPQLFLSKYRTYPGLDQDKGQLSGRIDLNKNFRCRENIVRNVNYVFRHLMVGRKNDLLYDEQASLVFGANYPQMPELETLDDTLTFILVDQGMNTEDETEEATDETERKDIEVEGQVIGEQIKGLLEAETMVFDKDLGDYRRLAYRDVVILLRSPKSSAKCLVEQLKYQEIPAYMDSGDGYFTAWEVQIVLAMLHILDNPLQDIPLAATLRAPFFAFTEEDLLKIRLSEKKIGLYDCLLAFDEASDVPLGERIKEFLAKINHWRTMARQKDLSSLLWQLYKETGFYDYVGALPAGGQRQGNLRALHEKARGYEQTSFKGLFMFLRFIQQMQDNQKDLEPAKLLGDNENVVRIMSIHKSKGLEFPVVFLANAGKKFNMMDINRDIVLDKDLGLGLSVVDPELNFKYPTICQSVIKENLRMNAIVEEKRVLYVAMTRAREKLYIIGSCPNYMAKIARYEQKGVERAQSYLDWLMPLFQHQMDTVSMAERQGAKWTFEVKSGDLAIENPKPDAEGEKILLALKQLQPLPTNGLYTEAVDGILSWQYPWLNLSKIKSKATVTEIKDRFNEGFLQEEKKRYGFTKRPVCVQEKKGLSATEKGTLIHLIMSHVDLQAKVTSAYLAELAERLENQGYIAAGQSKAVSLAPIVHFFQSELGRRLQQVTPTQVYRELPFTYTVPSALYDPQLLENSQPILVQGMIDCMWLEEGGWVLLDYKSDYVQPEDLPDFIQAYQGQVQLYAQAVEAIWKTPVKERYLYLFHLNQYIAL